MVPGERCRRAPDDGVVVTETRAPGAVTGEPVRSRFGRQVCKRQPAIRVGIARDVRVDPVDTDVAIARVDGIDRIDPAVAIGRGVLFPSIDPGTTRLQPLRLSELRLRMTRLPTINQLTTSRPRLRRLDRCPRHPGGSSRVPRTAQNRRTRWRTRDGE